MLHNLKKPFPKQSQKRCNFFRRFAEKTQIQLKVKSVKYANLVQNCGKNANFGGSEFAKKCGLCNMIMERNMNFV